MGNLVYPFGIATSVALLLIIVNMLRLQRFKERHALIWIVASCAAIVLSIFPGILANVAHLLGFALPANLVFYVSIFLLFLSAIQTSTELTTLEDKSRTLAEKVAMLENRVESLERPSK